MIHQLKGEITLCSGVLSTRVFTWRRTLVISALQIGGYAEVQPYAIGNGRRISLECGFIRELYVCYAGEDPTGAWRTVISIPDWAKKSSPVMVDQVLRIAESYRYKQHSKLEWV